MTRRHRSCLVCLCATLLPPIAYGQEVVPRGDAFAIAASTGYDAPGGRPGIASDGTNFLTVWRDARNTNTHADDPYAARMTRDGVVLDPQGIRLSTSTADSEWPSVAFDGTHYLVVWTAPVAASQYEVYGTIVATDGTVVAADIPITTTGASYNRVVSLAYDGTNFLVVWRTWVGSHIRATRVRRNGATLTSLDGTGGFPIATVGGDFYPWVTFGSGQYLVAWHAWGPSGNLDIFAARVSTTGVVLDPEGFVVSSTPDLKDHVSVAASGSNYLITFRNQGNEDIYRNARGEAVRITPNGTVIDTTPIVVADDVSWGGMMPVVFDGTDYFVLYQVNVQHNARYMDLMGRRISPAGVLLDPTPVPVAASFQTQGWLPMFAYGGGRFLAAWTDMGRAHICQPACVGGQILEKLPVSSVALQVADEIPVDAVGDTGWQSVASPVGVAIHSVDALDDTIAFAGTDNTYQLLYNGTNWAHWSGSFTGTDLALWGNAPDDVFAVGWTFAPKRFNGTQWIWTNVDAQRGLAQLAQGIWSSGRSNAFMVGTQGRALRLAGTNWIAEPTGVDTLDLWDVWGSAPNDVYAVGERGTLLHWDGTSWSRVSNVPTRQNLNAIWGTSATNIFAVGDFGTILHYDGVAWTQQPSSTAKHLTGVAGLSPTAIFASGFTGTTLRYNGATWQSENSGTTTNLLDVAVGGNTVWVVGDYGVIRRNVIDASHCARSLDRTAVPATGTGGPELVNFSTNCAWRAWSNASWIVLESASNGVGNATVSFIVQPNPSATTRTGTLIVGTRTVTVTQAGAGTNCAYSLNPASANHGAGPVNSSVSVTATNASCGWSAVSNAPWITVTSGTPGTGSGTVGYSLLSNPNPAARSGTITIAGIMFGVTQAGAVANCTYTLSPTSAHHGASAAGGSVAVTASHASCGWTAVSTAPWIAVTSGSPGTGSGTVGYSLLSNGDPTSRNGTIFIEGSTFNLTQAGLPSTLQAPTNLVASAAGNAVTASWTMPASSVSATGFVLEGGVTPGSVLGSLPTGSTAPSFAFSAPSGVFFIRVHAVAGSTRSAASNEVRIAVNVPIPPAPPANLVGEAFGSNLRLAWRNRFTEGVPSSIMLDVSGAVSLSMPLPLAESFAFSGVPTGTYTFAVRAANASGSSPASNPVTLTFPAACVPAVTPTNLSVTRNGNVISVSWTPAAGGPTPTGYLLTVAGTINAAMPVTLTSISGAVGPGSYTISVAANHPCGSSPPTAVQTVVVP